MRIHYHLSSYVSHRLSGLEYMDCLARLGHEVSSGPELPRAPDAVILHDDPLNYDALFARHPALARLRVIACCVFENERLAPAYIAPLARVGEIWTPSTFSAAGLSRHFSRVFVLPHVVRRHAPSLDDMAFARRLMRADEPACRFFSVVDAVNPRKNVQGLLRAFAALRRISPRKVLLALKQYRVRHDFSGLPDVISIEGDLTPGQMAALYVSADAYVSAHHAEGWGLGLSEAMAFGRIVIATGYSGNMDFMDAENSLPVPYTLAPVSEEMCRRIPLFTRDMLWAEIDEAALVAAMRRVALGDVPPGMADRAARIVRRFGPAAVAGRMRELLGKPLSVVDERRSR